jgi:hypothetical protein
LLASGIGGGAVLPTLGLDSCAFFTGGGGGFFFPRNPDSWPPSVLSLISICGLVGSGDCEGATPPYDPTLSDMPYLLLRLFADCQPDLTWSPCLSLKLFAVLAAFLASLNDTDDGLFRNEEAAFKAACF